MTYDLDIRHGGFDQVNRRWIRSQDRIDEKDLSVWMTSDMKPNKQCTSTADKTMVIVRMIKRNFK